MLEYVTPLMASIPVNQFQKISESDVLALLLFAEFASPSSEKSSVEVVGLAIAYFLLENTEKVVSVFMRAIRRVFWVIVDAILLELTGIGDAISKLN